MYEFRKQIRGRYAMLIAICTAIVILLLPHAIRLTDGNDGLLGAESYHNLRIAELSEGIYLTAQETVAVSPYEVILNPYHMLLAAAAKLIGITAASRALPFILGLLSVVLFYILLKNLGMKENKAFLSVMFMISSPVFMYIFTVSSHFSLLIFLNLLGLNLFIREGKYFYMSLLCYLVISLFGIFDAIASIFVLLIYSIYYHKDKLRLYILIAMLAVWSLMHNMFIYNEIGFAWPTLYGMQDFVANLLVILGSFYGFSIFMLFLVGAGIMISWDRKRDYYPIFISIALFLSLSFIVGSKVNIYLNMVFVSFAAISFFRLIRRDWALDGIRIILVYIILLGILFSAVIQYTNIKDIAPDNEDISALEWFSVQERGIVLSHEKNSDFIRVIAHQPPAIETVAAYDDYSYARPALGRTEIAHDIFYSRSLPEATELLDSIDVKYIYIDSDMKDGLVWDGQRQGLLFLLRNQETFKRIYNTDGIEIYEYIKR